MIAVALAASLSAACSEKPRPIEPSPVVLGEDACKRDDREARTEIKMPKLPANASCKQARAAYHDAWRIGDGNGTPDLSRGQFGSVLGRSHYFDRCGVPRKYEISICAAVQNGEVRGATVATKPRAPRLERCIDRGVRKLSFPVHPRMDVTQTVFTASL